jgi:adenylosuccinate synthase
MTTYDELPIELKEYIDFIEVEVPIKIVSVGQIENKRS